MTQRLINTRAMILAAGFGTRMKPLTDTVPKALLPINGIPMIVYQIKFLHHYGVQEIIINLHHLGSQIEEVLGDGSSFGVQLHYSREDTILGTGGGIQKARDFFKEEPFIVMNCDFLVDLNLKSFFSFHQEKKGLATMLLRPDKKNQFQSGFRLNSDNQILELGSSSASNKPLMFTGLHILTPQLLDYLPKDGKSCIIQNGYKPALQRGESIFAFQKSEAWIDLGTLESYEENSQNDKLLDMIGIS
jgi:NDP-sugar pyrophosphorylase family protein